MADFSSENELIGKYEEIKKRINEFRENSLPSNQDFQNEAATDTNFNIGNQSISADTFGLLPTSRRQQYCFNRIRRIVNMISGQQRKTRKSVKATPLENGSAETADQLTKLLMWAMQQENGLDVISDSFQDALVTGLSLIQITLDYSRDPVSGNIKYESCPYNSFIIDPYFRKPDLSDCNGILKRSYLSKKEIKALLPAYIDKIDKLGKPKGVDPDFPASMETLSTASNYLYPYDEFFYRDYRKQKLLTDLQTGESIEWTGKDDEALDRYLKEYPQVKLFESMVRTVRLAITVNGEVFYDGANPLGIDEYPFVPFLIYFAPQAKEMSWKIQGIVRGLRDPQYLYNRRKVIELDIMESRITTAIKYKAGALVRPDDVYLTGQGKALCISKKANLDDVQEMSAPPLDPTMFTASATMGTEIQEIAGVSDEMVGTATEDVAGFLAMQRQLAGLVTQQGVFDSIDRSQRILAIVSMHVLQNNFTPGKVQRIIDEQPTAEFYNKAFGKYDCVVEDGLNTSTQRQMQFAELSLLQKQGVNIPPSVLVEASTIQNKKDLIAAIGQADQQQQEMAQMKLQGDLAEQAARKELAESRAFLDKSRGHEAVSQIAENEASAEERYAEAKKDRALGELSVVKAMKELDNVELDQFTKFIDLMNMMRQVEPEAKTQGVMRTVVEKESAKQPLPKVNNGVGVSESVESGRTSGRLSSPRPGAEITI